MIASFVGVPFLKGGRDPKVGLDCYGLCKVIGERMGLELPDYVSPEEREDTDKMVCSEKSRFVRLDQAEPFCFVVFTIRPPYESHMGVVLEDRKRFIHTSKTTGCVIEKLDSPFWEKRIRGFYLWKN